MLKGIQIKPLERKFDERGFFLELMRRNWKEILKGDDIVQANLSLSYPGIIRAWHRHLRGQVDYFIALEGAIKICAYDEETRELDEITSTGYSLQMIRMPGEYWHGFKVTSSTPAWLLYFVNRLYDYEQPDEERRPWNDITIVPKKINGKTSDSRIGKPWNWNYPPHK